MAQSPPARRVAVDPEQPRHLQTEKLRLRHGQIVPVEIETWSSGTVFHVIHTGASATRISTDTSAQAKM